MQRNSQSGTPVREWMGKNYMKCATSLPPIRKSKSLDGNFGMGAKGRFLPSNKFGLRYRSCKRGIVHELILCERGGKYGRLRRRDDGGDFHEVVDVTEIVKAEGADTSFDWTEVTLLGNRPAQNRSKAYAYDGDRNSDAQWLMTSCVSPLLSSAGWRKNRDCTVARIQCRSERVRQFLTIPRNALFRVRLTAAKHIRCRLAPHRICL